MTDVVTPGPHRTAPHVAAGVRRRPARRPVHPVSDDAATATLEAAWAAEIRTFNTAPHYGAFLAGRPPRHVRAVHQGRKPAGADGQAMSTAPRPSTGHYSLHSPQ
jgi:hypothetical protein